VAGPDAAAQLLDDTWSTMSQGLSRLTVAASSVASATVATVKPGLQEVSQRYARGELAESAATLVATGADLGLKGLSNLKGLLRTAVSQIDGQAGAGGGGEAGWSGWEEQAPPAEEPRGAGAVQPRAAWAGWDGEGDAIPEEAWDADWGK